MTFEEDISLLKSKNLISKKSNSLKSRKNNNKEYENHKKIENFINLKSMI